MFFYIYISHGSVETHLWCDGMYNDRIIAQSASQKILKIGQYLAKVWIKIKCHVFMVYDICTVVTVALLHGCR